MNFKSPFTTGFRFAISQFTQLLMYTCSQACSHGGHSGPAPLPIFCAPKNLVGPRKICFKHIIKTITVLNEKYILLPQILKPGYGRACSIRNDSAWCILAA